MGGRKSWETRFARGVGEQLRYCHPSPRAFCSYVVLWYFLWRVLCSLRGVAPLFGDESDRHSNVFRPFVSSASPRSWSPRLLHTST